MGARDFFGRRPVIHMNMPRITVDNADIVERKKWDAVIAAEYAYSTSLHPA
jgi:hypothetical protein